MTANSNAPVRADARHNRELIIASAREVFALRGEQTNMCDIARQAGVGKGTLYRNFPDRKALLIEVIRARLEEFCEIARRAEEVADPFEALAAALRTTLAAIQDDAGLHFAMMHAGDLHHESIQEQKAAIAATYTRILKRAQAAGAVRSDLDFDDIQMILAGIVNHVLQGKRRRLAAPPPTHPRRASPRTLCANQPEKEKRMSVTVGFLAVLEAKPDKAAELAAFLEQGRELALAEPLTVDWYAFRIDQVTYGIFDTFEAEAGREAHQTGAISKALMAAAPELLAKAPDVRPVDVIAVK